MKTRLIEGIDFGPIWGASGVQGFFGEGYWFHKPFMKLGLLSFDGMTFVAKTTTLNFRKGNMPLRFMRGLRLNNDGTLADGQHIVIRTPRDVMPQQRLPDCVYCDAKNEVAINAVGLSGPGAGSLLDTGFWQERTEPFWLSFMSVAPTAKQRFEELQAFVDMFNAFLHGLQFATHAAKTPQSPGVASISQVKKFQAPVGLQINFSCPNVGLNPTELIDEIHQALACAAALGIPLAPKINLLTPPEVAKKICEHASCDALCVTNTIPWKDAWPTLQYDMEKIGLNKSPLEKYGGGGISGACLRGKLLFWLRDARQTGITKHINAGGGITRAEHVDEFKNLADSVSTGSAGMFACKRLQPGRVQDIIRRAHKIFGNE
ncbi:hypothetical protein COU01_00975 [Candidatus Falkowbacteria bacterium CG10_big_fil_rev_8_21_14_0_10_44_15]|uniref:Dihydroorotate dehydrogenase domain-containing protein n=1 Tax=Candidatus Falkowbacteria bacterium CG10_big_fil_rev_8_21_14_0_10_44_15 TaxID=1974569 RepID=A0A2H0V2A9_9BACT|nr:MAG: hypothetical protein COU01_00975 [Candidatus Falkowbacteria bacterium CG10_big_fil_rev_8_21_14_0_10_44_15]